ncbi:aspartate dehydrogenase [soil metagenome]
MASPKRLALIGYGAIGQEIVQEIERLGESAGLVAVLVREGRQAGSAPAVHDLDSLLAAKPDIVLECAGHQSVRDHGAVLLAAGVDLLVSSVGVLADDAMVAELTAAEARGGGRVLLPAGAIAGLDGLSAARLAGLAAVTYTSHKPPHAWRGTPAEQLIDLDHAEDEVVFFEGSAREAALTYPKNANVSLAVALAGIGLDDTRVRLVSSRKVSDPLGVIEAEGAFGRFLFEIFGKASASNPKTSALTAFSLLQSARLDIALPALRLIQEHARRL